MEHPVHFVPACSASTVDGLRHCAALRLGNHDTEVSAAPGAGAGNVVARAGLRNIEHLRSEHSGARAGSYALGAGVDSGWNIVMPKTGLRYFQITYARRRTTECFKLLLNWDKERLILGIQYKGGRFQWPDAPRNDPPVNPDHATHLFDW